MSFYHGVRASEVPSSLLSPAQIDSAITIAWGTAPIHLAKDPAKANEPVLCYELSEYTANFGASTDFENYTLAEVAKSQFQLYRVSPTIFINVLDPKKHFYTHSEDYPASRRMPIEIDSEMFLDSLFITSSTTEEINLIEDVDFELTVNTDTSVTSIDILANLQIPPTGLKIKYEDESENQIEEDIRFDDLPYDLPTVFSDLSVTASYYIQNSLVEGEDYTAEYNSDGKVEINFLNEENIFNELVNIYWHEAAPSLVTASDIIGSVDADGNATGLELIENIYSKFRVIPIILIAPKFSQDVQVAAVMKAKAQNINGVFKAMAIVDLPGNLNYSQVAEYKNLRNLVDENLIVCYPKVSLGGEIYHLSTQLAGLIATVDNDSGDGVPFVSPSNKNLQCDSSVLSDGTEKLFSLTQANYLNSQGITTALNFSQGWVAWGNRTSIYPSSTDPRENFIAVRRMFQWISNTIVTTYFQRVDFPINKRLLDTITDSVNIFLNGLTAKGALLGGRCQVLGTENPTTDLMDGIIRFHLYITPPSPAENLEFILEYDTSYISDLIVS